MIIPERYEYCLFGIIQSGFTCAVATAIASAPLLSDPTFISQWLRSRVIAWATMIPFVLLAAPAIRRAVDILIGKCKS